MSVEEALADINQFYGGGWPPSELDSLPIDHFLRDWQIVYERNEQQLAAQRDAQRRR